jgi:hypothetical protein
MLRPQRLVMSNGVITGSNRPQLREGTGKREFFASVVLRDGLIAEVK